MLTKAFSLIMLSLVALASATISRARVLQGAAGALTGLPLACEVYARAPPRWSPSSLPRLLDGTLPEGITELVVIFHGSGGIDANTQRIAQALSHSTTVKVVEYDWHRFTGDTLRAPFNAAIVGDALARELSRANTPDLKRVHLIGVSVGAFVANRMAEIYASATPRASIRLTLLDPFTARSLRGLAQPASAYGVERFGLCADEAVCVFNSDDPVPSTNGPLRHCVNLDVTSASVRKSFVPLPGDSLHSWPCAWFGLNMGRLPTAAEAVSRGDVYVIP
jgi:pimeloyl-ACP methyl ester carboxylesterase